MIRDALAARPDIDVIIVHYRASAAVVHAVAALRSDAEASSLAINIIVADNGSTVADRDTLGDLEVTLLPMGRNAGYAAAINASMPLTTAEVVVVMNEDVLVLKGCLKALHTALLDDGGAVAGPKFFWDMDRTFVLPCTEERSRRSELRRVAARSNLVSLERARRSWRSHARRFWTAANSVETVSLSGALLALRRDTVAVVGPFDSGFFLYYEDDDWLHRVRSAGLRSLYVPGAMAIHLHDPFRSAAERSSREGESFLRFGNRYYGEHFMRRLQMVSSRPPVKPQWPEGAALVNLDELRSAATPLWVELTPSPSGYPAAAMLLDPSLHTWSMPPLHGPQFLAAQSLYVQIVDYEGNELRRFRG